MQLTSSTDELPSGFDLPRSNSSRCCPSNASIAVSPQVSRLKHLTIDIGQEVRVFHVKTFWDLLTLQRAEAKDVVIRARLLLSLSSKCQIWLARPLNSQLVNSDLSKLTRSFWQDLVLCSPRLGCFRPEVAFRPSTSAVYCFLLCPSVVRQRKRVHVHLRTRFELKIRC